MKFSFVSIFLIICLSACVSPIKQEPFSKLSESVIVLKDGTNSAIDILIPQNIVRYKKDLINELNNGQDKLIKKSAIQFNNSEEILTVFSNSEKGSETNIIYEVESVPSYMKFDQFKVGLNNMAEALYDYTILLRNFANRDIQSQEELNKFIENLNNNAFEAVKSINSSTGEQSAKNVAIVSTATSALFNSYLKNKQKKILVDAIASNQKLVEEYTNNVGYGIDLMQVSIRTEYQDESNNLKRDMLDSNLRSNSIDSLIKINREYFSQTQALKALKELVLKYPIAHEELKKVVINSEHSLVEINNFMAQANQLKNLAESSRKYNSNSLISDDINKIEAKAISLETEAKIAALDLAKVQADSIIARIEANNNKNDLNKEKRADELEKKFKDLKIVSDQKTADAQQMRELTESIKNSIQNYSKS